MDRVIFIVLGFHWGAVIFYAAAIILNTLGLIFNRERALKWSYILVTAGLLVHGAGLLYRWVATGHGPYMVRHEVLSSDAWIALLLFLLFRRAFPRISPASLLLFPVVFLATGLSIFLDPSVRKLPPTLKSIWLVLHVGFTKIAVATMLIALAFSLFYVLKKRTAMKWLKRLPDLETLDMYAYRFAGFGFTFWTITTIAGGVWAYESWGRFWGWDPIETWALITWIVFGFYLHLRRFFGMAGEKAAYLYMLCFLLSIISVFFVPLLDTSIHSSYFR